VTSRSYGLRYFGSVVAAIATTGLIWTALLAPQKVHGQPQGFSFALIGDLGYYPEHEPWLANLYADIGNDKNLSFVVHLGDLSRPVHACTQELLDVRLAQFNALPHPVIFTPGDNDWADCHEQEGVKGGEPAAALARLRAMFFADETSLGGRKLPLTRQSQMPALAKFRENARWDMGGVTFVTIHVTGSNNNLGRTPDADTEYRERDAVNQAWLRQAFTHAKVNASRAVVILQQANIFENHPPLGGEVRKLSGFLNIREAIEEEAIAFRKPVVLAHGDSHFFRIDNPLWQRPPRGQPGMPAVENFLRVEVFGTPNHHWLHVTVDPNDPNVFTFRPRIVAANVIKR
jgi:Calcineurin-like phosphoesterase